VNREELISWARQEADRVEQLPPEQVVYRIRPQTTAAVEFLQRQAPGSQWALQAVAFQGSMRNSRDLTHGLAGFLRSWAQYVEDGLAQALPLEVERRIEAANDLMEQVEALLRDASVHPAAPVVLIGAGLEQMLRSMLPEDAVIAGSPGLDKYGAALKKAGAISATEAKDVTAWAGQRNDAAHGHFEDLSRERARIMADAVNAFMRRHDGRL
jgi:hypothetical protein